jgi:hypothetical protein
MDHKFAEAVKSLHPSFERLVAMAPYTAGVLPRGMPLSGIYLFSEAGKHLYVGRSRDMRRRYGMHTRPSAQHNSASFAFLLARETTGMSKASYQPDGLSRAGLSGNKNFSTAFDAAKKQIRKMEYRFVEETDPTRQALLEIYCSVALAAPYNDFNTH